MFTVWIAENQDGYTYTRESFDFKSEDNARTVTEAFKAEGYIAEMHPHGQLPTFYQSPFGEAGISPLQHILNESAKPTISDQIWDEG